jgi:hypothetical protein
MHVVNDSHVEEMFDFVNTYSSLAGYFANSTIHSRPMRMRDLGIPRVLQVIKTS